MIKNSEVPCVGTKYQNKFQILIFCFKLVIMMTNLKVITTKLYEKHKKHGEIGLNSDL